MNAKQLYLALQEAIDFAAAEAALNIFESEHRGEIQWLPIGGRENNRGAIEASADPGRSLVERLTNGIDAILEVEHIKHNGQPVCRNPKEAATAWLNIPEDGLSEMTPVQRRLLAQHLAIKIFPGDGREGRVVEILDRGIGISPEEMPRTILSLNESNKVQKLYLAGTYGQGGSSTFAVSKYTLIGSRSNENQPVGFTLVRYLDLPPEKFKTGHYVYLTLNGSIPTVALTKEEFNIGTIVKHFGYDLSNYSSP